MVIGSSDSPTTRGLTRRRALLNTCGNHNALCRREERIWQQCADAKKSLQVPVRGMLETAAKKIKVVKLGDNVMVPDLGRAKIGASASSSSWGQGTF